LTTISKFGLELDTWKHRLDAMGQSLNGYFTPGFRMSLLRGSAAMFTRFPRFSPTFLSCRGASFSSECPRFGSSPRCCTLSIRQRVEGYTGSGCIYVITHSGRSSRIFRRL
jgi:hypothetical protein